MKNVEQNAFYKNNKSSKKENDASEQLKMGPHILMNVR